MLGAHWGWDTIMPLIRALVQHVKALPVLAFVIVILPLFATRSAAQEPDRVRLDRVEVSGITVHDVEALVVPDESLSTNLLGMSFLSRVKWSHDRGRLVLEQ